MKKLPISIVIPVKNEEKYLPRLLESIKNQTHQPVEIIIADADSTDKSVEIAKKYDAIVIPGGTVSVGRNRGAKRATQKAIFIVDADVVFTIHTVLADLYNFMQKNNLDGTSCQVIGDEDSNSLMEKLSFGYIRAVRTLSSKIKMKLGEYGWNMMFDREKFWKTGGFDEEIKCFEDYDFISRFVKKGYKYRVAPFNVATSGRRYKKKDKLLKAAVVGLPVVFAMVLYGRNKNKEKQIKALNKMGKVYGELGGESEVK